mgnify:CR=1 FL=1
MNKAAILNTAVLKREDDCFVVESPLLPQCIGAARSAKTAWAHFNHHVEDTYDEYLKKNLAGMQKTPGRPAKTQASLSIRVKPRTKRLISKVAKEKSCSQGELVDYLMAYWEAGNATKNNSSRKQNR